MATNRSTKAKTCRPGWNAWHSVLKADTNHYYYGYSLNNNGSIEGPYGDPGSWETREYGERDDFGCPAAPLNGKPCFYETDRFNTIAWEELTPTSPEQPFYLQLDYTAPHGDFRRPAGPEPATRHYNTFAGAPYPHSRSEGFNEGNVNDKPRFIREAPYLSLNDIHTYRVYYQKALESLRSIDEGVKLIVDTLGGLQRLRNTYIIFISDNGFFYGEHRLTGGKFLAYEPATHLPLLIRGPGIKPGTSTGELAANIDIAPTILELAGAEADKSIDAARWCPTCATRPCALDARCSSSPSSRPPTSKPTANRPPSGAVKELKRRRTARRRRQRLDRRPAERLRGNPPRPLQVHRVARRRERALRHHQGPERAEQRRPRPQPLPDPRLPPRPAGPPGGLRRPRLPGSSAAPPAHPRPAAQGRQAAARRRTAERKGTRRKASPQTQRLSPSVI